MDMTLTSVLICIGIGVVALLASYLFEMIDTIPEDETCAHENYALNWHDDLVCLDCHKNIT